MAACAAARLSPDASSAVSLSAAARAHWRSMPNRSSGPRRVSSVARSAAFRSHPPPAVPRRSLGGHLSTGPEDDAHAFAAGSAPVAVRVSEGGAAQPRLCGVSGAAGLGFRGRRYRGR
jgi:hypothetical protein